MGRPGSVWRMIGVVSAVLLAATACGSGGAGSSAGRPGGADASRGPIGGSDRERIAPAGAPGEGRIGVDLVPVHIPQWIFGSATASPLVQPSSQRLAGALAPAPRLHITPLPSGEGTTAIDFIEDSPPGHSWGELMIPTERVMFRAFAADPSLGWSLVVVTDVKVLRRPDPIMPTAYRWTREQVEEYARCGIPSVGIDACTAAFYTLPEMTALGLSAGARQG